MNAFPRKGASSLKGMSSSWWRAIKKLVLRPKN
jgi:hypothetical protein